mgnify:CR=1 FL=1
MKAWMIWATRYIARLTELGTVRACTLCRPYFIGPKTKKGPAQSEALIGTANNEGGGTCLLFF